MSSSWISLSGCLVFFLTAPSPSSSSPLLPGAVEGYVRCCGVGFATSASPVSVCFARARVLRGLGDLAVSRATWRVVVTVIIVLLVWLFSDRQRVRCHRRGRLGRESRKDFYRNQQISGSNLLCDRRTLQAWAVRFAPDPDAPCPGPARLWKWQISVAENCMSTVIPFRNCYLLKSLIKLLLVIGFG